MDILQLILTDYTLRIVSIGSMLLGIISGVLGSFAVVRKESLLGDAVSHAALPGICFAFIFTGTKNTEVLLLGALVSGIIATFLIINISKYSRVKFDSALAFVLSVFFGGGLVLLTYIQKKPNANQAGLEKFIFGQASTLMMRDIKIMFILGILLIGLVILFWKEFKLISFDIDYAESLGFDTKKITAILFAMIVTSIIIGLQTVGVILMSAMLTAPAVAARQWTDKFSIMVLLSSIFGALSGLLGTLISSLVPKLPTGPMIVVIISITVVLSIGLAPNRGILWRHFREKKNQKNINKDQVLISLYDLVMKHESFDISHDISTISPNIAMNESGRNIIRQRLEALREKGYAKEDNTDNWLITEEGIKHVKTYFSKEEE